MIDEFCWMDLVWLAALTVWLQVSDYSQLSDYNSTEQLEKNKSTNAPITSEEVVMVMIQLDNFHYYDNVSTRCLLLEPFTFLTREERVTLLVKQDDYYGMMSLWLSNEWIFQNYPDFFLFFKDDKRRVRETRVCFSSRYRLLANLVISLNVFVFDFSFFLGF